MLRRLATTLVPIVALTLVFPGTLVVALAQSASAPATQGSKDQHAPAEDGPPGIGPSAEHVFKMASPAVAKIVTKDEDGKPASIGSGFFIPSPNGKDSRSLLVTNYHVIQYAASAEAQLDNGETVHLMEVLAEDPSVDLAILRVLLISPLTATHERHRIPPPPTLTIEDRPLPPVGSKVYVIGSPEGLTNTLSEGLVSGHRDRKKQGKWLQITAPVSPGSSGGPVLDTNGKLIGIVTCTLVEGQNLNLAIPGDEVKKLLKSQGKPRDIWKGTSIEDEADAAESAVRCDLFSQFESQGGSYDKPGAFTDYVSAQVKVDDPLTLLYLASEDIDDKRYEGAIKSLTLLTKSESCPHVYFAWYLLGCAHQRSWGQGPGPWSGEDVSRAEKLASVAFKKSAELNPDFAPAFYHLLLSYERLQLEPEALVAAEFLVRLVPRSAESHFQRGYAYQKLKRYASAIEDYKTALDIKAHDIPYTAKIYHYLGGTYRDLGEWEKAIAAYESVIRLHPDGWGFYGHSELGDVYDHLGRYREALDEYRKACELCRSWVDQSQMREMIAKIAKCEDHIRSQTP